MKRPFGGPQYVLLQYLGRYTHRVAISNHRLVSLTSAQQPQAEQHGSPTGDCPDLWRCPECGGPMKVIERLTAAEIQLRSPPRITSAA